MHVRASSFRGAFLRRACAAILACMPLPGWAVSCSDVTLKGASGVIGMKHGYAVSGHCRRSFTKTETSLGSSTSYNYAFDVEVSGKLTWDRKTQVATEYLKFSGTSSASGPVQGVRLASGTCSQDPFLKDAPGGKGSCKNLDVKAEIKVGKTPSEVLEKSLWLTRSIALVEAQALSNEAGQKPAPKPQPSQDASGKTASRRAAEERPGPVVAQSGGPTAVARAAPAGAAVAAARALPGVGVEGETLAKAAKFQANAGKVAVQPMTGFGPGWSGNEQLFWSGGSVGAVIDLLVDVPGAGMYALELYLTRAPDYARLKLEVDGQAAAVTLEGYAPKVTAPVAVQAGTFSLKSGQRRISFMIVGKHPQSTGYLAGIDRIQLIPASRRVETSR